MPDREYSKALRSSDLPFEIVANHPHIARGEVYDGKRVPIGLLLRLPEAVLTFDLDMIEVMLERKPRDLGSLYLAGTIRNQGQSNVAGAPTIVHRGSFGLPLDFFGGRAGHLGDNFHGRRRRVRIGLDVDV